MINYNAILIFTESHISENDFKSDVMTSTALLFFWQKLTFPNSSIFPNNNRCNVSENQKSNLHAPPTLRLKEQSTATGAVHPPGVDKDDGEDEDEDDDDEDWDDVDAFEHWVQDHCDNCRWLSIW